MPAKTKKDDSKISFFGEIDLNDQGKIKSDMPAWYLERQIDEMEEGVSRKERMLKMGTVDPEVAPRMREEVKAERKKLEMIKGGRPNLTGTRKDTCFKVWENLGRQIGDSMPTRKQAKDGLVNPYDEMKRLKNKHITVNPEIAAACGVTPHQGKITGDEANKCYQILGKALGENTSVEALRKDGGHPAHESIHELTKLILEGRDVK